MNLYATLGWLLPAPDDFGARIKAVRQQGGDLSEAIRAIAAHALDTNQLLRVARLVDLSRSRDPASTGLAPFRLGIVSNATTEFITPAIAGTGARYGLDIECITTGFGQFMQAALDPDSAINRAKCDAIVLALDSRAFTLDTVPGDAAAATAAIERALGSIDAMVAVLGRSCPTLIVQTAPPPPETLLGNFDALLPGSPLSQVSALNRGLLERCDASVKLLDVATMAAQAGLADWHDAGAWNLAKQPFGHGLIPFYADSLCRLIAALRGKSRKALVLDLDNTLWAGVIGDDGMDGINMAQGDATGEAHLALQRYALALRERGVVLAVCSKNTDSVARQVFREHPDMLLREEHIAVFQANWDDKASNLRAIAGSLNIGLDALVFVDDNPAERELVRQRLPLVAVPELPADAARYARTIAAAGYFEMTGFSDEDRHRADFYAQNARRVERQASIGNIDDYLISLDMKIHFGPFDEQRRARIAQLINKSNQFNLTTRRYTEGEVAAMIGAPGLFTLRIRLEDSFGDNGMISTVICRAVGADWEIDTWLMSCRVLGRKVECAVLDILVRAARRHKAARLIGRYIPTERNVIVADHYAKLGFAFEKREDDGTEVWTLALDKAPADEALGLFAAVTIDGFEL
ncbi:MAG: HAD-IIIC family phosphatase [Pseudomonadota bacterium]|nr:HAD-IIIC family phosphatase [Pseudomonadota bacterium]